MANRDHSSDSEDVGDYETFRRLQEEKLRMIQEREEAARKAHEERIALLEKMEKAEAKRLKRQRQVKAAAKAATKANASDKGDTVSRDPTQAPQYPRLGTASPETAMDAFNASPAPPKTVNVAPLATMATPGIKTEPPNSPPRTSGINPPSPAPANNMNAPLRNLQKVRRQVMARNDGRLSMQPGREPFVKEPMLPLEGTQGPPYFSAPLLKREGGEGLYALPKLRNDTPVNSSGHERKDVQRPTRKRTPKLKPQFTLSDDSSDDDGGRGNSDAYQGALSEASEINGMSYGTNGFQNMSAQPQGAQFGSPNHASAASSTESQQETPQDSSPFVDAAQAYAASLRRSQQGTPQGTPVGDDSQAYAASLGGRLPQRPLGLPSRGNGNASTTHHEVSQQPKPQIKSPYENPSSYRAIHIEQPSLIRLQCGDWVELRCYICGGNHSRKHAETTFISGVQGFQRHLTSAHGRNFKFDEVLQKCAYKRLPDHEVTAMLQKKPRAYKIERVDVSAADPGTAVTKPRQRQSFKKAVQPTKAVAGAKRKRKSSKTARCESRDDQAVAEEDSQGDGDQDGVSEDERVTKKRNGRGAGENGSGGGKDLAGHGCSA